MNYVFSTYVETYARDYVNRMYKNAFNFDDGCWFSYNAASL